MLLSPIYSSCNVAVLGVSRCAHESVLRTIKFGPRARNRVHIDLILRDRSRDGHHEIMLLPPFSGHIDELRRLAVPGRVQPVAFPAGQNNHETSGLSGSRVACPNVKPQIGGPRHTYVIGIHISLLALKTSSVHQIARPRRCGSKAGHAYNESREGDLHRAAQSPDQFTAITEPRSPKTA